MADCNQRNSVLGDHQLLEHLKNNALWIIMDPWYPHCGPEDVEAHPDINERNLVTLEAIADYLPKLKHVVVSCGQGQIYSRLKHIPNVKTDIEQVKTVIDRYKIKDIVWVGLHHGRCILNSNLGVKRISSVYPDCSCWIKKDLVCTFPVDNELNMDEKSSKFATLI